MKTEPRMFLRHEQIQSYLEAILETMSEKGKTELSEYRFLSSILEFLKKTGFITRKQWFRLHFYVFPKYYTEAEIRELQEWRDVEVKPRSVYTRNPHV